MTTTCDPSRPREDEIVSQLIRIVESEEFRSRKRPIELLTLLVKEHLKGNTLDEGEIRERLYQGPYDPEGANVRTAVSILRTLLDTYYEHAGASDPVIIALPQKGSKGAPKKGSPKPYPVTCSYQSIDFYEESDSMGHFFLKKFTPKSVNQALMQYETLLALHEPGPQFQIKLAKLRCLLAKICLFPKEELVQQAVRIGGPLIEEKTHNAESMFLYLIALALAQQFPDIERLALEFKINSEEHGAEQILCPILLTLIGRSDLACHFASGIAQKTLYPIPSVIAGFAYYFSQEFKLAETHFEQAAYYDRFFWPAHLGSAMNNLALNKPKLAAQNYSAMNRIIDEDRLFMPCLGYLIEQRAGLPAFSDRVERQAKEVVANAFMEVDWLQYAMMHLDTDLEACQMGIELAFEQHHPFLALLPMWSLFDPLREWDWFNARVNSISELRPGNRDPQR